MSIIDFFLCADFQPGVPFLFEDQLGRDILLAVTFRILR